MKFVWIFSVVSLIVISWEGYKDWKQIRKIVKKKDLRKGRVVGLLRTGSIYLYRVGDCRVYTWVVALEDEENTTFVPTLHTWNIHPRNVAMLQEKFNRKEKGKKVDVVLFCSTKKRNNKRKNSRYVYQYMGRMFTFIICCRNDYILYFFR